MRGILCGWVALLAVSRAWAGSGVDGSPTRIAFLSDTHVTLRTNEPAAGYNRRFDQAITEVNTAKIDLVLIAGDLTDQGTREQMELFKRKVNQLKPSVMFVAGNHDVGVVGNRTVTTSITPERVKLYAKTLGPNWFVREKAGVRVIGINSCLFGTGFKEEEDQWKFLEKELARLREMPNLLLEHHPPFIQNADEPRVSTWNVQPASRQRLLALLERAGIRAVLSGHLHYPLINRLNGTLFLGNSTTAFALPRGVQPEGWMLLDVPHQGEVQYEFRKLE